MGSRIGSITFGGLSSTLPTDELIDEILKLERRPIDLLEAQKAEFEQKLGILQDLNTRTLALRTALRDLDNMNLLGTDQSVEEEFRKYTATPSDTTKLAASADGFAKPGSFTVRIDALALEDRERSQGYADLTDTVGTGTFTITTGTASPVVTNVTIDASNDDLQGFVAAINSSGADVTASILNDGSGSPYRIVISGNDSGDDAEVTLDVGSLSGGTATPSFVESQDASDAQVTLDPGAGEVTVTSATNKFTNIISGVTIDVLEVDPINSVTVRVEEDVDEIVDAIASLVTAYNDVVSIIAEQNEVDATTNRGGPLIGDSTLVSLQRRLSGVVASQIGSGDVTSASQLGLSLDTDGKLSLDEDDLRTALGSDLEAAASFFAGPGSFADQLRSVADDFVDTVDGSLVARMNGTNSTIAGIDENIDAAERRLDTIEENLVRQFAALEQLLSQFQLQGNFLSQFLTQSTAR